MGRTSLLDKTMLGRPVTATDKPHEKRFEDTIWKNHQIKQKDIALKLGISKERVDHIIRLFGFRNFVPGGYHENWL